MLVPSRCEPLNQQVSVSFPGFDACRADLLCSNGAASCAHRTFIVRCDLPTPLPLAEPIATHGSVLTLCNQVQVLQLLCDLRHA